MTVAWEFACGPGSRREIRPLSAAAEPAYPYYTRTPFSIVSYMHVSKTPNV